ncbi:MAG: DNA-binding protein YbiB [Janthinobacterium lividum]
MTDTRFSCSAFIKEIGRGANGARALSRADAQALYSAMLDGRVGDVELGAVLMAYRIKGETAEELAGMLSAAQATLEPIQLPADSSLPVVIPSYNGARKQANLVPLLASMLAREGIPVLVHGVTTDPGRVTSAEIFAQLGVQPATSMPEITDSLARTRLAFAPIEVLSAPLARLLALRRTMGVRNSTHTLVKLLQPFRGAALRLVNYTHPPYREALLSLFERFPDEPVGALLARGTEGEAVADTRRQVQVDWVRSGGAEILTAASRRPADAPEIELPTARDAGPTASWINDALDERVATPEALVLQVRMIREVLERAAARH